MVSTRTLAGRLGVDGQDGASQLSARVPRIGISLCLDPGQRLRPGVDYLYVKRDYTRAIARAKALPVLLTPDLAAPAAVELCDALVIPGGGDLPHRFTDAKPVGGSDPEVPERIGWERALIDAFRSQERPILGVCYGMQLLNLHLGGTLVENLSDTALDHGGGGRFTSHEVAVEADARLLAGLSATCEVSSSHHQAVADVAEGFRVVARASDGVIEAIEAKMLFGVEWHPESDATATQIYANFVRLVSGLAPGV